MDPTTTALASAPELGILNQAIAERWRHRRWYRAHPWTLDWPTRWENEIVLRALVKLARANRKAARAARPDLSLSYHDWQAAG